MWSAEGTTAKGWLRTSTDEFPGGVVAWVGALSVETLSKQIVLTEPVTIDWALAEEWLEAQQPLVDEVNWYRGYRHWNKDEPSAEVMRRHFPRELSECNAGKYGKPCVFRDACHNPAVGEAPLTSGKYQRRVEHHPLAMALAKEAK